MNQTADQLKPTGIADRIDFLDVLRGIAIQFIFMRQLTYKQIIKIRK